MSHVFYPEQQYYSPPLHSPVGEEPWCKDELRNLWAVAVGEELWCEGELEYYREEQPVVRVVRRRNTANKKERRRTQSINNGFADLRNAIPNVPKDTKLSKIKTLRLATSYIGYLMGVLEGEDYGEGFRADLGAQPRRPTPSQPTSHLNHLHTQVEEGRRLKGRTGWPQHVWALELKQEVLAPGEPPH